MADIRGSKKGFLSAFMLMGAVCTLVMYFAKEGDWLLAAAMYFVSNFAFAASLVYYDSMLPHIARPEEQDAVSSKGYAVGYIGGGLLLAIDVFLVLFVSEWAGAETVVVQCVI